MESFSDIYRLISGFRAEDQAAHADCIAREPALTKPAGSLGRLEEITLHLSSWQGTHPPRLGRIQACVFAGNHGVAALGVSAFPAAVTQQMVINFQNGGAAINQLCRLFDIDLTVHDLDLDHPTENFTEGPAMSEAETIEAFEIGFEAVEEGADLLIVGEMGIGNTTSAAALCMALFGGEAEDWTGRGTGVGDEQLKRKTDVVRKGVLANPADDPLIKLAGLGGRELAAIVGAVTSARLKHIPTILDGYVCCAAAAVLHAVRKDALDHCLVGHVSAEPGHKRLLERLEKRALLDLDMRLGEGSGAAVAIGLVKAALACHTGMATFGEAGVSNKAH
jgi:nicotinate-nucleotide--dimethylbenzimidazole phosphoribosyltransferase